MNMSNHIAAFLVCHIYKITKKKVKIGSKSLAVFFRLGINYTSSQGAQDGTQNLVERTGGAATVHEQYVCICILFYQYMIACAYVLKHVPPPPPSRARRCVSPPVGAIERQNHPKHTSTSTYEYLGVPRSTCIYVHVLTGVVAADNGHRSATCHKHLL
jgi:hypothetical protein